MFFAWFCSSRHTVSRWRTANRPTDNRPLLPAAKVLPCSAEHFRRTYSLSSYSTKSSHSTDSTWAARRRSVAWPKPRDYANGSSVALRWERRTDFAGVLSLLGRTGWLRKWRTQCDGDGSERSSALWCYSRWLGLLELLGWWQWRWWRTRGMWRWTRNSVHTHRGRHCSEMGRPKRGAECRGVEPESSRHRGWAGPRCFQKKYKYILSCEWYN